MRWLKSALLLCPFIMQSAYAQSPAPGQKTTTNQPTQAGLQTPFHTPLSERKNTAENPSWTAPQRSFRIYGNTWNVGPHGLGVFLVTAPTGNVLIDGGVPGDAPLIEANIRALGINLRDIKWILNSHTTRVPR